MSIAKGVRLLLMVPTLCGWSLAQQGAPPPTPATDLPLDVVVTAKNGVPVAQLQQKDFTLFDNKAPQAITSFRALSKEAPVEAIFVVDAVNVPAITVSYERQELDKYLNANGGKLAMPTSLAVLTDKGVQAQGGGSLDGKMLAQSLDQIEAGLRSIGRSTGFYGAEERLDISQSALNLLIDQRAKRPGRKLLIWISPGWPLLSGIGVDLTTKQQEAVFARVVNLSTRLRVAGITLYVVDPLGENEGMLRRVYYRNFTKGIVKPSQTDEGDLALQVLATQSGGLVLNSSNDLAGLMKQAVDDASAFYEIRFAPSPGEHAREYHSIDVRVDQPGLTARTRQGYYAQP
jgi:VWFA-related protein